jgi:RHS repeat-associated protein
MDCIRRSLLLIVVLALTTTFCSAQVQTGTPPFGSFGGGPDVVNLANLNVHLSVPVFSRPGRGLPFNFYLTYDNSIWYPVTTSGTTTWTSVAGIGWSGSEVNVGSVVPTLTYSTSGTCGSIPHLGITSYSIYAWAYTDGFGTRHPFSATSTMTVNTCTGSSSTGFTGALATDLSGYSLSVSGITVVSLYSADGNLINTSAGSIQDRNGNKITKSSGVFTDTLGTTALTVSGSGTSSSPTIYTYTPPNTTSSKCVSTNTTGVACYAVNYTNYTLATNFGVSGIHEGKSSAAVPLVTSVVQADGSQYTFAYEVTPSIPTVTACTPYAGTTCTTGRIAHVILPTGGTIYYSYSGGNNGVLPDGSTATLSRITPDGTWTYAQVKNTGAGSTTTITDPSSGANQTVIQFQGMYETFREIYQGSPTSGTLLRWLSTCYNGNFANCGTSAVTLPITERTVFDGYGLTGPQCEHNYLYNASGGMTEQDDYDYGPTAPGALLRKIVVTFASLGNVRAFRQTVTTCNGTGSSTSCNGTGTPASVTTYNYDQTTPIATTGIAQHVAVTGSRGNLTSINYPVTGLTENLTYYDTGSINTDQDVNGATTTYTYSSNGASCQQAFPTGVSEPLSLSRSVTWNCTGGVQLTATDENSQVASTTYSDPYFWRPASANDQQNNSTGFYYGTNPMWMAQSLLFNGNQSIAHTGLGYDGLGRLIVTNHAQTPSQTAWDQVTQSYDSNGRPWKTSAPCVTTGPWTCPTTGQTTTYDALNRPIQVTDAGGGTTTYTYTQNDVLVTVGPAPGSENTKRRQLEYNSIGQLTSVCELTTLTGSGTCGQNSTQTGYWTKYTYDALGDLLTVTQNAQASSGNQEARSYSYDAMSRVTSETNPESGTTTYVYDSVSGTPCTATSRGDLIKRADANGNYTCFNYDALHRLTDVGNNNPSASNPGKRFRYDNTSGYPGSTKPAGTSNTLGRLAEAATDAGGTGDPIITDEWFSYTVRGEVSDVYELTPHSSPTYYHVTQTYWPNGGPNVLAATNNIGLPTITYGAEGEGRPSTVSASSGQNPVTATNYYNLYQSPYSLSVTLGSGDSDVFTYDPYTFRLNKYQFNVGSQTVTGTLGWNANWSLGNLGISDPFSTANTQSCSFTADDLSRISQTNCGTIWGQNFSYDPFGNIQKNAIAGTGGSTFTPTYQSSPSTNRVSSVGGVSATYDANGNSLFDTFRTSTWNVFNNPLTIGSVSLTYDALDRMVEQSVSGTNSEIVYSPAGVKLALMNGTTLTKAFVPLPGGETAVYTSSGLAYYRHTDHLGSSRFASTPTQTLYSDLAYSPFGETYAQSGAIDPSFTGQNQDTTSGLYDFMYREHDPNQARWTSPDPAGLGAVDSTDPQSWNRYAYVGNNPSSFIDPLGLCPKGQTCLTGVACRNPANWSKCPNEPPGISDPFDFAYGGMFAFFDPICPPELFGDCVDPYFKLVIFVNVLEDGGQTSINYGHCANSTLEAAGVNIRQQLSEVKAATAFPGSAHNPASALLNGLVQFAHLVNTGDPFDYKNQPGPGTRQQRVDAGNIAYGVSCPFGAQFCQLAAGAAQTASGSPDPNGTLFTLFDTPSDNASIRVGQAMRAAGCHE